MASSKEREQKHQLWKERISEYESSGLSVPAWCKEQQIPTHQMRYWLRKFRNAETNDSKSDKAASRWVELDTSEPAPGVLVLPKYLPKQACLFQQKLELLALGERSLPTSPVKTS